MVASISSLTPYELRESQSGLHGHCLGHPPKESDSPFPESSWHEAKEPEREVP